MLEGVLGIIWVVLGVVLLVVVVLWMRQVLAARKGQLLQQALEIESLRSSMKAAIRTLKMTKWGMTYTGQAAFYELPWYIVIGPAAAGKSTFLRQSGLHFPFTTREELGVKGFGGTRQCDWWFSDKAIFLDTAGRYTTEEADHAEWMAFLEVLQQHRCPQPIHGILMVIPLMDIVSANRERLTQQVQAIRARLEEINQKLGAKVPTILVLTKLDILPGFESFFNALPVPLQEQIFGLNLLEEESLDNIQAFLKGKLETLYAKLSSWRAEALKTEMTLDDKVLMMNFPEQFRGSMTAILNFMRQLQRDDPSQETPCIQGLYFTSATHQVYFIQTFFAKVLWPLKNRIRQKGWLVYPKWMGSQQLAWVGIFAVGVGLVKTLEILF